MPDLTELARLVDRLLPERALVFGSLPGDAHDIDVLARPGAASMLSAGLAQAGFAAWRGGWARVDGCRAHVVDVSLLDGWGLTDAAAARLFDEAVPMPGMRQLARPAEHHELLILARRCATDFGPLDGRRARRIEEILATHPGAVERAAKAATSWQSVRALDVVHSAWKQHRPVRRYEAFAARCEQQRRAGRSALEALVRAALSFGRRPPVGAVLALSRLDGAGTSTQADALVEVLRCLGFDACVERERLATNDSVEQVGRVVKALLGVHHRPTDWAIFVAVVDGVALRRKTNRHLRRGRLVVRDRYVLDSLVRLHENYQSSAALRLADALVRRLPPVPLLSLLLDVPPEIARQRKGKFSVEVLRRHRQWYLDLAQRYGVGVLDGTRPAPDLCQELVEAVAQLLGEPLRSIPPAVIKVVPAFE